MKKFLSIEKFKDLKVLFRLEFLMALILIMLVSINKFDVNYFDWRPLLVAIGTWGLCSIINRDTYFNLATLLGAGSFTYMIFWFIFNL